MTGNSETLLLLESLAVRMASNEQLIKYLAREEKGHIGEKQLLNELKKIKHRPHDSIRCVFRSESSVSLY